MTPNVPPITLFIKINVPWQLYSFIPGTSRYCSFWKIPLRRQLSEERKSIGTESSCHHFNLNVETAAPRIFVVVGCGGGVLAAVGWRLTDIFFSYTVLNCIK